MDPVVYLALDSRTHHRTRRWIRCLREKVSRLQVQFQYYVHLTQATN